MCIRDSHTWAEVQKMTLKNQSQEVKTLKVFSFAEWCLWNAATDMENFQRKDVYKRQTDNRSTG